MAGQLTIDTLKASSGVLATQNGMTGIAKAWCSFNGATATINGSFNVSSLTRTASGQYTLAFSTAMPNANYCIYGSGQFDTTGGAGVPSIGYQRIASPATTSNVYFQSCNLNGGGFFDGAILNIAVVGN